MHPERLRRAKPLCGAVEWRRSGQYPQSVAVTDEDLLSLGRRLEDKPLATVSGRLFTVGVYLDGLVFTPASSGLGQSDG